MKFLGFALLPIMIFLAACGGSRSQANFQARTSVSIQNKGSDTIVNLALAWAEKYQAEHPEVSISVTGGGSGTGIAALLNKTVDIANASRQMQAEEIQQDKGFDPVEFVIARDAIAVIVNPTNPVSQLTLQQISDIYSGRFNNWSQVGGQDRPIVRLSREVNSGTHVYFRDEVIRLGEKNNETLFATDTLLLPSSEGIVSELRQNPNAIGYDGLGYVPKDLKVIAVAKDAGSPYVLPSIATVNDKSYPVARDLYMYTAGQPTGVIKAYLDWVMTNEAQTIVANLGFVPILE
jgi:phosphate transport system substrate-binding protein